jgi:hypothetical protein
MCAGTASGESTSTETSSNDVASAPLDTQTVDEMLLQYLDTTRGSEQQQEVQESELDQLQTDEVGSDEVQEIEIDATSELTSDDRCVRQRFQVLLIMTVCLCKLALPMIRLVSVHATHADCGAARRTRCCQLSLRGCRSLLL